MTAFELKQAKIIDLDKDNFEIIIEGYDKAGINSLGLYLTRVKGKDKFFSGVSNYPKSDEYFELDGLLDARDTIARVKKLYRNNLLDNTKQYKYLLAR